MNENMELNLKNKTELDKNSKTKINELELELEKTEFVHIEGGWGWIVVIACGYCFGLIIGMANNYALLYNEFDRVYNQTENHIVYSAWIGSYAQGLQYFLCPVISVLIDLYGVRNIGLFGAVLSTLSVFISAFVNDIKLYFLTYGTGFGIGQACLITATFAILPHYYDKRLSLANGIMCGLASILILVIPICTNLLLEHFNLKVTFFFLASLNFVCILMACTFRSMLPENETTSMIQKIKNGFGIEVLKKFKFVIWCVASFIGMFGYYIPIVNIDHFSIKKFPNDKPYILNVVFGLTGGVSSILFGKLGDMTKFNRVHYHTLVFIIYGIIQLTIPFAKNFIVLNIQLGILGFLDGIFLTFMVPIAFDLCQSSKLVNQASGYYHFALSFTSIAGPAIAGKIYEVTHLYDYAFYMGGVACLVAAFVLIIFIFCVDVLVKVKFK